MVTDASLPCLDAAALRELAARAEGAPPCPACAVLAKPGWEALPGTFDAARLQRMATLRNPQEEDPTLVEYHPDGTHAWSPDAPIAPGWFPYNRCDLWQCTACGRPFLRYTEYGGYYIEERIRPVNPGLVVTTPPP